jgi:hypothetical protein
VPPRRQISVFHVNAPARPAVVRRGHEDRARAKPAAINPKSAGIPSTTAADPPTTAHKTGMNASASLRGATSMRNPAVTIVVGHPEGRGIWIHIPAGQGGGRIDQTVCNEDVRDALTNYVLPRQRPRALHHAMTQEQAGLDQKHRGKEPRGGIDPSKQRRMVSEASPGPLDRQQAEHGCRSSSAPRVGHDGGRRGEPQDGGHRPQPCVVYGKHVEKSLAREWQLHRRHSVKSDLNIQEPQDPLLLVCATNRRRNRQALDCAIA